MPSDIFNWLPPEVHINIVKYIRTQADHVLLRKTHSFENDLLHQNIPSSLKNIYLRRIRAFKQDVLLEDIRSFTSASPTARRYFYANQCASFVRPYIQEISEIFEDVSLVPLAAILLQARKVRARTRGLTASQIEQSIRPCLDAFTRFENCEPEEEWKVDLGCIRALTNMKQEFDSIWDQYYWQAGLQPSYRSNVINHLLRYDLYCQLGCHGEEKLSAENKHIKELESHLYKLILPNPQARRWERINMLWLIKKLCQEILLDVDMGIKYVGDARKERNQVDDIIRQGGPREIVMQRLRECRFKSRQECDTKLFLDHLCLQGYPFILHLQKLSRYEKKSCILDVFFKITAEKLQFRAGMSKSTRYTTKRASEYRSLALGLR